MFWHGHVVAKVSGQKEIGSDFTEFAAGERINSQMRIRVLMVGENCSYRRDPRIRREAAALRTAGHLISVICPADKGRPWCENIDGVVIYGFRPWSGRGKRFGYLFESAYSLIRIALLSVIVLVNRGFDVIHVANPPDATILLSAMFKVLGKRIIYDQHDLCPELYTAKFSKVSPLTLQALLWMEDRSYRLADQVITANHSYKKSAMLRGGVKESKITVVRNGPEANNPPVTEIDFELRSRSKNLLVYAGTIGFQDGVDVLLGILHQLRFALGRKDFYCVVIGDGDALPRMRTGARKLHVEDKVWFAGWVTDPQSYRRFLSTADICLSPEPWNTYNDKSTFLKVLDFMEVGKPIVAFDLAETRFSAGESALYARPNDRTNFAFLLTKLMDNPALRHAMGCRGQQRIREKLAWKYSVPGLLQAYEGCLARKPRSSYCLPFLVG
jgi:glycosyltransferase involved in cell wall biosynthesis